MKDKNSFDFEFDEWAKLAEKDPQGFEAKRLALVEEIIAGAPDSMQTRLRGLQWQLDTVRDGADNPMSACLKMSKMMWDKVLGEDGLLESMRQLGRETPQEKKELADVVALKPKAAE